MAFMQYSNLLNALIEHPEYLDDQTTPLDEDKTPKRSIGLESILAIHFDRASKTDRTESYFSTDGREIIIDFDEDNEIVGFEIFPVSFLRRKKAELSE